MGNNIDLINNLSLTFSDKKIFIHDNDHEFVISHGIQLVEDKMEVFEEGVFEISPSCSLKIMPFVNNPDLIAEVEANEDPFVAFIDADKVGDLSLRKMREGDRFSPLGMKGHKVKISEYFINQKIPRRERENWPILFSNHEIIWVVGFQISDKFHINNETQKNTKN